VTRLVAVEFFKLRKRMMTWVVGILLIALIILLYSVLWSISGRVTTFGEHNQFSAEDLRRALFLQGSVPFALEIAGSFGTILAIILAAGAVGSEYSWGTIRLMATASSGRIRLIIAKLIVVFALTIVGVLLAVIVAIAYSAIITNVNGGSDYSFVNATFIRDQWASFGRTIFVMAPYITLGFAAAVIGRSTLAGAAAGIGVAFIEPLVSNLMRAGGSPWKDMPNYLIASNTDVISAQNKVPPALPSFGPDARDLAREHVNSVEKAVIVLAIYIVVFIALALIAYRRRDITAAA
jgi:ABC-type transport system involved in multi-copper enzyme maturation permease subunit